MDYGQMLGGGAPQPSAPTAQMPGGGMPQQPQDPTAFESATCVQLLEKLAELWAGDESNALKVERMALELKRMRSERSKKIAESMRNVQQAILPPML